MHIKMPSIAWSIFVKHCRMVGNTIGIKIASGSVKLSAEFRALQEDAGWTPLDVFFCGEVPGLALKVSFCRSYLNSSEVQKLHRLDIFQPELLNYAELCFDVIDFLLIKLSSNLPPVCHRLQPTTDSENSVQLPPLPPSFSRRCEQFCAVQQAAFLRQLWMN